MKYQIVQNIFQDDKISLSVSKSIGLNRYLDLISSSSISGVLSTEGDNSPTSGYSFLQGRFVTRVNPGSPPGEAIFERVEDGEIFKYGEDFGYYSDGKTSLSRYSYGFDPSERDLKIDNLGHEITNANLSIPAFKDAPHDYKVNITYNNVLDNYVVNSVGERRNPVGSEREGGLWYGNLPNREGTTYYIEDLNGYETSTSLSTYGLSLSHLNNGYNFTLGAGAAEQKSGDFKEWGPYIEASASKDFNNFHLDLSYLHSFSNNINDLATVELGWKKDLLKFGKDNKLSLDMGVIASGLDGNVDLQADLEDSNIFFGDAIPVRGFEVPVQDVGNLKNKISSAKTDKSFDLGVKAGLTLEF